MAVNQNWPAVEYSWGPFWGANKGGVPQSRFVEISTRTRNRAGIRRGRQFELDQIRTGEATVALANRDGAFDPGNAAGPWAGSVTPYQPLRIRAQWPPTVNLLTPVQATGGDAGGYPTGFLQANAAFASDIAVFTDTDPTTGQIVTSGTAWQGTRTLQFGVTFNATVGQLPCWSSQVAAEPGTTYTMQMQVRNITSGSTTLQVRPVIGWVGSAGTVTYTAGGTVSLVGSPTASWTRVTVTATAPASVYGMVYGVQLQATLTVSASLQVDGWQLEKAASASTWVQPGTVYPVFGGFIERYPQTWTANGTYGRVETTSVDQFSLLSQRVLREPLTEEIFKRSPRFVFRLSDPQGSQSFTDSVGAFPPAPVAISKFGAGSLTAGSQITSTSPGGTYIGSTGTVVSIANSTPGTGAYSPATFISLNGAGIAGPANPLSWTRMIAFRYTGPMPAAGFSAAIWHSADSQRTNGPSGSQIIVHVSSTGLPGLIINGPGGTGLNGYFGGATNVVDGNWHLLIFGYDQASNTALASQDGATASYYFSQPTSITPTGLVYDSVGNYVDGAAGNATWLNYQGDIAFAVEFPGFIDPASQSSLTALYNAWKNSFSGDSSNARYARILGWAGYTGTTSIQAGLTTSMGPAAVGGQDALSALQAVVDTESGAHYVDRAGILTFRARSARYNALTPAAVLGERADLGEVPYEECALEHDPTRLANIVKITQTSTGQEFSATDTTSQSKYFPRTLSRTINASSAQECQDAANYLISRYKAPAPRISRLRLHPSANPAAWATCLSLELGTRIRVMRRPPSPAPASQVECFVEAIDWVLGDDGDAVVDLQCSPADLTPYALFASFHTTLAASASAGAGTITINAGADTVNPAAAQIGQGQQLILGLGAGSQETVTVQSVAATTTGWSTVVITLTASLLNSHALGETVCEPLPSGVTDATTWDGSAKFDSTAFAY
ncbi:hypothetical protein ACFYUY_01280 [Kitasatospora sp. NPDC004745]|uniref:hypothetical protein n=1 Tax=Kitasatospora sp. NPDC004745 TaxID=3364019 RepID=UPI0036B63989